MATWPERYRDRPLCRSAMQAASRRSPEAPRGREIASEAPTAEAILARLTSGRLSAKSTTAVHTVSRSGPGGRPSRTASPPWPGPSNRGCDSRARRRDEAEQHVGDRRIVAVGEDDGRPRCSASPTAERDRPASLRPQTGCACARSAGSISRLNPLSRASILFDKPRGVADQPQQQGVQARPASTHFAREKISRAPASDPRPSAASPSAAKRSPAATHASWKRAASPSPTASATASISPKSAPP